MVHFTRREFLATSIAAPAAMVLPGRVTRADNGGLSTGFSSLDELVGGLQDGWLVVLAGWPRVGKTALALAVAQQAAIEDQLGTLFVTLEMSQRELTRRLLRSQTGVPCQALHRSQLSGRDRREIVQAAAQLSRSSLFVNDKPASVADLHAQADQLNRQHLSGQLRLLVVDSLQLIEPCNRQEPWQEQMLQITSDLKALALDLDLPIVCTVQMDAASVSTRDRRPRLGDIRESGPIEPYADLIIFAHRQRDNRRTAARGISREAEFIVAKHGSGPVGRVGVCWDSARARFDVSMPRGNF